MCNYWWKQLKHPFLGHVTEIGLLVQEDGVKIDLDFFETSMKGTGMYTVKSHSHCARIPMSSLSLIVNINEKY